MKLHGMSIHRFAAPLVLLPLGATLMGASCGTEYQCQVLCRFPSGITLGSNTTITVRADSLDEANQKCPSEAQKNYGTACNNGGATIVGCSCYESGVARFDPPSTVSTPVLACMP